MNGPAFTQLNEGCTLAAIPDALTGAAPWTIGYGCTGADIGSDTTWTQEYADKIFTYRYAFATERAEADLGPEPWATLDDVRKAALIDMAYQMGGAGLAGFPHMLAAVRTADWTAASEEILNSKYDRETRSRAERNAKMIFTGEWPNGQ